MKKTKVIAVVGATASGKTSLAVEIAKAVDGEIISSDSMQIYKGMTIATAQPSEEEKQGIPHHLIAFLEPDETYSVAQFAEDAKKCIADITANYGNTLVQSVQGHGTGGHGRHLRHQF